LPKRGSAQLSGITPAHDLTQRWRLGRWDLTAVTIMWADVKGTDCFRKAKTEANRAGQEMGDY
jgi:hypothetical protein